jgi:hypothetical protein
MDKLKKKGIDFIEVSDYESIKNGDKKKKGHILTQKGLNFLAKIKKEVPIIEQGDYSILKPIIIESEDICIYICLVKNAGDRISSGVEQRDAAIKIDGLGATCLIFNGKDLVFPSYFQENVNQDEVKVNKKILKYITIKLVNANQQFQKGDVIIIGLGDNKYKARLAALNASLTLLK